MILRTAQKADEIVEAQLKRQVVVAFIALVVIGGLVRHGTDGRTQVRVQIGSVPYSCMRVTYRVSLPIPVGLVSS